MEGGETMLTLRDGEAWNSRWRRKPSAFLHVPDAQGGCEMGWLGSGWTLQAGFPGARREREGKLGEPWSVGIGSVARGPGCLPIKVGLQVCLPGQGRLHLS